MGFAEEYHGTDFTGVFDGNNKIIGNAVINQPGSDYIGLFGSTGPSAQIRNLGVEDVNMTGNSSVGGLAVMNYYGTITGCYATGTVSGAGNSVVGRAVVVHRDPDDYKTQPAGNSGPRVACGVIAKL
jgi:Cu/Zn superoxide dismutase